MKSTHAITDAAGRVVCARCVLADSALRRLQGLLGRRDLPSGEGLLLRPAFAVHTCFMRFAIDAVFLDRELRVLGVAERVRPWRTARLKGARAVLELAGGEAGRQGILPGERLELRDGAA